VDASSVRPKNDLAQPNDMTDELREQCQALLERIVQLKDSL
jgi:hypothetical protein